MASIDEACSFLLDSLQSFLKQLFTSTDGKMKLASLGQAIVQATCPRVIWSSLQLGLGIQLHHHFASKFLIDTLHKHDFCCSYKEVANAVKLKNNVIRIDPQLLFQRLVTAGVRNDSLGEVFKYELCSFPPSLFEDKCTPRLPNKASLADVL